MTQSRRRTLSLLAAAVVAAGAGLAFDAANGLRRAELATVDARFKLRGDRPAPDSVVVVGIDQRSIDAGEGEYPLNRSRDAEVLRQLKQAGAAVIAYDVPFTDPGEDIDADNEIYETVSETQPLVLGTSDVGDGGTTAIFGGGEALADTGATPANTDLSADLDGRVRQVQARPQRLEAFALAAARLKLGGELEVPGDTFWVDYPGSIETVSFVDVEQGRVPADKLRGKVVVVGTTAPDRAEFVRTPLADRVPAPEVHAAAVATALEGFPLTEASGWGQALAIVLLGALGPLLLLFGLRARYAVGATVLAALAYLIAAKLAFDAGTLLAVVPALVAALIGGVAAAAFADPERSPWQAALDRLTHGVRGNLRTRRLRAALLLAAAALAVGGGLVLLETDALQRLELSSVNRRFDVRGEKPPPPDVVLVAIDERTFVEPPSPRWPFPRRDHARVVRHLEQAGASVIAYDVQFSEPDRNDPGGDEKLIEATRGAGNVVMGTTEVGENGQPNVFFDADTRAYSRAIPTVSNLRADTDGRIRRVPFEFQNRITFALASAQEALGHRIQTPGGDTAWINFAGGPGTIDTLSFVDVRRGNFDRDLVRGKVVVVGATSTVLQDLHATSTTHDGLMPGPEIHANAIQTALDGFPLRSAPNWLNWLLVILLGALTPFLALRRGIVLPVIAGAVALGVLLVVAQVLFNNGTIVAVVYPALVGVVAILASAAIHGLTVAFEREQARDAFARFVPEAVVDQVLADSDGVRLGGVRGEATVMFSDLRGFTSFSETLEPERVIEALNMYLTEMSEAILDHGGTLVAYMGDGIMAVFGAPLKQPDHADRALEAARDMLARMGKFNGWLREQELHDGFKMGIGLNSGPVMSGNVGSERRLEYTALGDTTNTAARLEGMTKGTPHQLYISDTTKQMLTREAEDLVAVGEAEVRGRKAKVLLWSLREGPAPAPAPPKPASAEAAPEPTAP